MKKLLPFSFSLLFVLLLGVSPAWAQPPFELPSGSITWQGHVVGPASTITLPYVELNSTNYYSLWVHGDPGNITPVVIQQVEMWGSTDFTVSQEAVGTFLGGNDSVLVQVKFVPTTLGEKTASCIIGTNGHSLMANFKCSTPPGSVLWQGNMLASGSEIDLGEVEKDSTTAFTMWFKNTASSAIQMNSSAISSTGAEFTLLQGPENQTIATNDSVLVKIQFAPLAVGEATAQLTLAQDVYTYHFNLKAKGINTTTGIRKNTTTQRNVYPNPASDNVWFGTEGLSEIKYSIVDMTGKVVHQGTVLPSHPVSVAGLSPGLYQFRWSNGDSMYSQLVSKQ